MSASATLHQHDRAGRARRPPSRRRRDQRGRGDPGPPGPDRRGGRPGARLPARRHRRRAGRRPRRRRAPGAAGETLGPLAGVPLALKDVIVTRGMPTTVGSRILEGWIPPYDATVTTKLREAGIVMLGKTNMDEFAMGSSTENSAYGPSHNPWDLDRVPGGSSGGSSAAVAAFSAPLGIGTDTGGSIRQPAAVTGIVGPQADVRRRLAVRAGRLLLLPRPGRPVRPHGAGRGAAARGDGRARPDATRPRSTRRCRRWSRPRGGRHRRPVRAAGRRGPGAVRTGLRARASRRRPGTRWPGWRSSAPPCTRCPARASATRCRRTT